MIHTYPNSIIYVLCPAKIVTGGIEAVHQLVDQLRRAGHTAKIVPLPLVSNPFLLQYRNYDVEFASQIEDHERNILITTEVNPRELDHYRFIQKALWWLSVDNHENLQEQFDFSNPANNQICHFAQSAYAHAFLSKKGITDIHYLSDYLHQDYFKPVLERKNNLVLYTPVKGADAIVNPLIQADPSLQWLPLRGMIRKMHARTLRQGKVYVDFGSHPGKDRQPREAAANGCCVIVGLRGSARFFADIPIPEAYTFDVGQLKKAAILSTIKSCLVDYEQRIHDFADYAASIRREKRRFAQEVIAIFGAKTPRQKRSSHGIALANTWSFIRQNDVVTSARGLINEFLPVEFKTALQTITSLGTDQPQKGDG
jgi:hypothetical protein